MCVMHVNKAKHTSFLFLDPQVFLLSIRTYFFQMCGDPPKHHLVGSSTMSLLFMILVILCGSIFSKENVMCLMFFVTSLLMLNAFYLVKSCVFNQTGVGNTKNLATHFFGNLALLTTPLVHTHTNRMARPKGSTVTLLTWVSPYYRMHLCLSGFGMRRISLRAIS